VFDGNKRIEINVCCMSYTHAHFLICQIYSPIAMHNIVTILCNMTLPGLLDTIKIEAADSP
jgi:hypothetical protein